MFIILGCTLYLLYIKVNLIEGTSIWDQSSFHFPTKLTIKINIIIDLKNVILSWKSESSNSRQC